MKLPNHAVNMGDETATVDRNDPELKYLTVEKNQFNDPATQAEWTQKRLVWVPHEAQVRFLRNDKSKKNLIFECSAIEYIFFLLFLSTITLTVPFALL